MPDTDAVPGAALALHLIDQARAARRPILAILRSASRLPRIAAVAHAMGTGTEVLVLPPWDVLPYDPAPPSPAIVGQRMRALQALARPPAGPRLLLTAAAALQRVRPAADLQPDPMLRPGDALDP